MTDNVRLTALLPVTQGEREPRLRMFLEILSQMGEQSDASEYRWNWINAFLHEREGLEPDTFNIASDRGFTTVSHDSDTDHSTVYLTNAGREYLFRHPDQPKTGELESYEKFDGIGLHSETIETRAHIGERYLEAYESALDDPRLKGYTPADCPSELLLDLLNADRILAEPGNVDKLALDKALALPWHISSFEPGAGGGNRMVMGIDNFAVAYISGRSEAEHQVIAEFMLAASQQSRPSPAAPADRIEQVAAKLAASDGLTWAEVCPFEGDDVGDDTSCDSGTCVAAHYEDHDPDVARANYRKWATVALEAAEAGDV